MFKKLIYLIPFILVLGLVLTSTANAADPNLVGWWNFDGDALDSSGNERHGTLNGNPQFGPGVYDEALEFDGDDYVAIDGYKGVLGPHAFSIAAWVKQTAGNTGTIVAWGQLVDGARVRFLVRDTGQLRLSTFAGRIESDTYLSLDEWYHVAVTKVQDQDQATLYLNGQDVTSTAQSFTSLNIVADADVGIGWDPVNQGSYFTGIIDDVLIYDKVLTLEEIQQIIEGSGGEPYPFASSPGPANGAILEATWVNLSWSPGVLADSHDVYIGDNFDDVNDGAESTFQGNQTLTTLIVGFPGFAYPEGLVPGTTYYWRIDEVNVTEPNSPWKGDVWSFTIPPRTAYDLIPADGIKFVDPDVELSWTGGFGAKLHYVHFGDNFDDVNNAIEGLPQAETTYTPGTLEFEKVYYWRIDEFDGVNTHKGDVWSFMTLPEIPITDPNMICLWTLEEGSGTIVVDWSGHGHHGTFQGNPHWVDGYHSGGLQFDGADDFVLHSLPQAQNFTNFTVALWVKAATVGQGQFMSPFSSHTPNSSGFQLDVDGSSPGSYRTNTNQAPGPAFGPVTTDWVHLALVAEGTTLQYYYNGTWANSYTYSTDELLFNEFIIGVSRNRVNHFDGTIDDLRVYDRALTQAEIQGAMRGDLLLAWDPKPSPASTLYIKDATPLSWSPGDNASGHDVYFGTDRSAVADADVSDTTGIYRGRQGITIYTPPEGVEWGGGPYYWRIDEYNTDATISKGNLWSFTVADFIGIDDFEDYNDYEPDRIFETWIDGWGVETNGSEVGYAEPNFPAGEHHVETTIVHGGGQSMPFFYENNFKYSEATMTLVRPRDWTEEGVGVLSLWFYGDASNAAERIYVALNGIATVYHGNPDAALIEEWTEWTIDLQEFAAQGVNLANVNTISIGFGDKNNLQAGGSGLVFFDDIRLYRPAEPEPQS
jgi:hypothetical protein